MDREKVTFSLKGLEEPICIRPIFYLEVEGF